MAANDEQLLTKDVCDILEDSAKECVEVYDQHIIQLATCPRAHASVQGLVERNFHPSHMRDFYSVINFLLLQLYLIRRDRAPSDKERDEVSKLKKHISNLEKKRVESKKKYEELYKINQQWSDDYNDLQKQLQITKGGNSSSCQCCLVLSREVEEKKKLVVDLNASLEKMKSREKNYLEEIEQKNTLIQDLLNECSALRLQFQEIGGVSAAIRQRDNELYEVHKLKEKNTQLELERANLQTQINRFRHSVRQLLFDSTHYSSQSSYANHASSNHAHSYLPPGPYDIRVPPAMKSDGYVLPKQFAPHSMSKKRFNYRTTSTSTSYIQPPTPPGLISRGRDLSDEDSPAHYALYEPHPYKPETISEQVIGGRPLPHTSSQYLEPISYINDKLPSPGSLPRPLSAPGSLLLSPQPHSPVAFASHDSSPDSTPQNAALLGPPIDHTHPSKAQQRPMRLDLNDKQTVHSDGELGRHGNSATPLIKYCIFDEANMFCPHCNISFPRKPDYCDQWLDHISACNV